MIEAFSVGAIFRVSDEASPVLMRMVKQLRDVGGIVDKIQENITAMGAAFRGAAESGSAMAAGLNASFARVDDMIATTTAGIKAMAGEMKAAAASMAGAGGGAGLAAGRGAPAVMRARAAGAESREGIRLGGYVPLPGHMHARVGVSAGGMAGLAAGAMLGYGAYEEAEIEDIASRALLTGQIKVDAGMTQTDAFRSMRGIIQRVSAETGFAPKEVGEAILTTERQFGGLSFKDRLNLEETLIPYAAAEARMKETSLAQSFEAMVGLSHMTGTYDPKQLPELMRQFAYASMITPVSIPQFQRAISYSMPMLHAGLDMDPAAIMFLTAMTQTAGITNTKSGTWLRSFFENAEPRIGDSKADVTHNLALREMGLLDAQNRVTWQVMDTAGKTDWDASIVKMSELINKFTQATDPAIRLGLLKQAFGERGGGEAALMNLTQFIGQFPVLESKMKSFMGGENILTALTAGSPVQQVRTAWADAQNIMMDIGQHALPAVVAGLKTRDAILHSMDSVLGSKAMATLAGAGAAAAVGGKIGGAPGAVIGGLIGGALAAPEDWFHKVSPLFGIPQGYPDPFSWWSNKLWGASAKDVAPQPVNVTVNVGDVKAETADPLGLATKLAMYLNPILMKYIIDSLHLSNQNNQGAAGGTQDSPYATGLGAN